MNPERTLKNLKITRYEHGGGRIYFEDGRNRDLVADAYEEGYRELIYEAIKASLSKPAEEPPLAETPEEAYNPALHIVPDKPWPKPAEEQVGKEGRQ